MADKPPAEFPIDERLVRELLISQAGGIDGAASLPLVHADDGWDCSVWRLGSELAVRLPRREMAASLIEHEQHHLAALADRLAPLGVPAPILSGVPDRSFPWPWSVVPWFSGESGLSVPRSTRVGWAQPLAEALVALHVPALGPFPPNPFRGVPLVARDEAVRDRLHAAGRVLSGPLMHALTGIWQCGLDASPWTGSPVWIHGDLHPGNLVARGPELVALIDFGDLTAGDPAYDLAVAWLAFDRPGRALFHEATGGHYDEATWMRARAWAAAVALMLVQQSDDDPAYRALGEECIEQLAL